VRLCRRRPLVTSWVHAQLTVACWWFVVSDGPPVTLETSFENYRKKRRCLKTGSRADRIGVGAV